MQKGETISVVVSEGAAKIEVPSVVEQSENTARGNLETKGFEVKVEYKESDKQPGEVLEQDPTGGTQAEKGSRVTLTVSKQAERDVPPVTGQQFDAAKSQLETLGFQVKREDVDSEQPANTVVGQTPDGGSKAPKGSEVTLKVSKGPQQPQQVPVPEVRPQTLGQAKQTLGAAGFTNVQVAPNCPADDNAIVTGSDPQGGTPADPATTTVTLTTLGCQGGGNNGGNGNNGDNGGDNDGGFFGGPSGITFREQD
jgi:serine/threonine-protein kinase